MAINIRSIMRQRKCLAFSLCIISCFVLMIKYKMPRSNVTQHNLNFGRSQMKNIPQLKDIRRRHFCHDVNANWPKGFPKIVEKQNYMEQKIPQPFFEFSKYNNTYLDSIGEIICPTRDEYNSADIISMIASSWSAYESRMAMRKTLGIFQNVYGYSHLLVFLIGRTETASIQSRIQREADLYGDILQIDTDDSYRGMTKKRFQGLKWVLEMCQKASLVLCLTDDVVVHMPNLIKTLQPIREVKKLAFGGINTNIGKVVTKGKNGIFSEPSLNWTAYPYIPDYLLGFAIVVSVDVATDLYKLVCKTPMTFSDDSYIGILLAMLDIPMRESGWRERDNEDRQLGKSYNKTKLKELIHTYNPIFTHLYSDNATAYMMEEIWKDLNLNKPSL
ncbi:unnamed protein product [Owenia fusiformis]|uniref:Hexosyltransferase n=1 Tax=Owenia fusiformis TaxID=6347 RepID=A0A8J1XGD2_OWEFU|nr:unnamed protein product [Owenia fusiformis]